jgi:hypothetical protein
MTAAPTMLSVFDGRELRGFILSRGRTGFEAFDCDLTSCGIYPTQKEAAASLPERKTT